MPTNTYVALDTQTLSSSAASVTFNSINQGYTDLIIVTQIKGTANTYLNLRFNGDTGSNYSRTIMSANGSSVASENRTNATVINTDYNEVIQTNLNYVNILQIMNYSNTTTNKTILCRPNNAASGTGFAIGMWRNTAAITSVSLIANNNSFDTGSTFTLYGIASTANVTGTAKATGGTITYDTYGNVFHTFTSSGTFTPSANISVDYLVVAGGGGAAGGFATGAGGGGGGAGGYRYGLGLSCSSGTGLTVTVGAGGAGDTNPQAGASGSDGNNSVFGSITSTGGGGGGGYNLPGRAGGSGGGGGNTQQRGGAGNSGNLNPSQGFAGGSGNAYTASTNSGTGGGGGAGGFGGNPNNSSGTGASGGPGLIWAGNGTYYAGGGAGAGGVSGGTGGVGGGGAGKAPGGGAGTAGTANTGGGGGGAYVTSGGQQSGGSGGSGIVIIKYSGV